MTNFIAMFGIDELRNIQTIPIQCKYLRSFVPHVSSLDLVDNISFISGLQVFTGIYYKC